MVTNNKICPADYSNAAVNSQFGISSWKYSGDGMMETLK